MLDLDFDCCLHVTFFYNTNPIIMQNFKSGLHDTNQRDSDRFHSKGEAICINNEFVIIRTNKDKAPLPHGKDNFKPCLSNSSIQL